MADQQSFPPIERFRTLQQELISLHRRIEAIDTSLGILIATGTGFVLYAMGQRPDWKAGQGFMVGMIAGSIFLAIYALVFVGNNSKDWLNLVAFFERLNKRPGALQEAIDGGLTAFERGRTDERDKTSRQKLAFSFAVLGAIIYAAIGYDVTRAILITIAAVAAPLLALFLVGTAIRKVREWTNTTTV